MAIAIDLVLKDIGMPIIHDWELAFLIKVLKPHVPIAEITVESSSNILPRLKGSGVIMLS